MRSFSAGLAASLLAVMLIHGSAHLAIAEDSNAAAPATQPAAKWAASPTDHWPALLLKNQITVKGFLPWTGVSGFLMKLPGGQVVAVTTCRRLVQGVNLSNLKSSVTQWVMHPPNRLGPRVEIRALAMPPDQANKLNCVVLTTIPMYGWPSEVLVPSQTPTQVGQKVFMADVADTDHKAAQHIFKGIVRALNHPTPGLIAFQIQADVAPNSFSGGPILDEQGHVVGIGQTYYPEATHGSDIMAGGMQIITVMETIDLPAKPTAAPAHSEPNHDDN